MKITVDKVRVYPPHALCGADIRLILLTVPEAWAESVEHVRLSASMSSEVALYSRIDETLTISSRGHTKEDTLHRVLAELAAYTHGYKRRVFENLQARYKPRVEILITPLIQVLLPKLSQKKVWLEK